MKRRRRVESLLLWAFDPEEREQILADLEELAAGRAARRLWYWTELAKYPVRRGWDVIRHHAEDTRRTDGRRGAMEPLLRDVRYALRSLIRDPGFTVTAVLILAVSMGAASSIYSVVDGVLLQPLPLEEPDRLVSLWLERETRGRARMTPGNFRDVEALEGVFAGVAAFGAETASLAREGGPVFLRGSRVTPGYFETLGVRPLLGRGFRPEEGEQDGAPVVVLGHHVWQQMFGGDPDIVRRTIELDGRAVDVVGVVPPGVYPTEATVSAELPFTAANQDFFVPLRYGSDVWANRRSHVLGMIGRLTPGLEESVARDRLAALSGRLQATEPLNAGEHVLMTSFTEEVVGDVRFALLTLLGSVALVLLIAAVNVGALFTLRGDDRGRDMAVRAALGASAGRLARQSLVESALVVGAASLGAFLVARFGLRAMRVLVPYQIPRLASVEVGGAALAVTLAAGGAVALALGSAPVLRMRRRGWGGVVGRARQTAGVGRRRFQGAVVAVQAALCVIVLVGAALLSRSYEELRAVDPGYDGGDTWTMSIPSPPDVLEEIRRRTEELPGVASAAVAYDHPLERNWGDGFVLEGVARSDSDPPTSASLRPFGDGYFQTVGIEVVEGRLPDAGDARRPVGYAVVNETLARTFFPDRSPLGASIVVPTAQRIWGGEGRFEISAVVRDVRFLGPDVPPSPALYVPLTHFPASAYTLVVRPERADEPVAAAVRAVVAEVDPSAGVQDARRLDDILDGLLARPRFNMMLLVSFAVIGLVLCGLGAYGLVARLVAMRVREIGIQMALGADRPRLARAVMAQALRPVLLGGGIGLLAAAGLARAIRSLLFGVSPADPVSFAASATFVLVVGVVAAALPTARAVTIDPAGALRAE